MAVHHPDRTTTRVAGLEIIVWTTRQEGSSEMVLATDYPFLDIMWTMFIFFAWVIWIWLLIMVLADNFGRRDHSGWAKAGWTLFVIFLPLLGVLVYMIARPPEEGALMRGAG
jgi:hypothetical protein